MNDDEVNLYEAGTKISMDNADENYTVKLKAVYGEPPADVKYAVSIYGIKQDLIQTEGKVAGLTFGPATKGNYTGNEMATEPDKKFYKACSGTSEENPNRSSDGQPCMHWMSWSEIIAQANADPTVFEPCLKNGCTHSVELRLSKSLKSGNYIEMTGDGAGVLSSSIEASYRQWNSSDNVTGGWPASRIRTTLNGSENCEPDTTNVAGSSLLSQADALISAFPPELQAAIIPKAVKSDTVYNDINEGNKTTYDKLWLFSIKEITADADEDSLARPNEGTAFGKNYQRIEELGTNRTTYCCNENGLAVNPTLGGVWSRSLWNWNIGNKYACVFAVSSSGELASKSLGISPGFCIGIADAPKHPQAVLYKDGTMIFYEDAPDPNDEALHSGIVNTYTEWSDQLFKNTDDIPWYNDKEKILTAYIKGHISPKYTSDWFFGARNMKSCDLNNLDTSKVIDMSGMFYSCDRLTTLDLNTWNIEKVKDISYMFYSCDKLSSLDLSSWNPCNVESIDGLFSECKSLKTIYANDWTGNPNIRNSRIFSGCTTLPNYNSSNVLGNMCKPQSMGGYFTDPQ